MEEKKTHTPPFYLVLMLGMSLTLGLFALGLSERRRGG
jgi:hypothetical protein